MSRQKTLVPWFQRGDIGGMTYSITNNIVNYLIVISTLSGVLGWPDEIAVKQQAEDVLKQLGIPMATAIDMYLRQITLTGGIPFSLSLPKAPAALNADTMTDDQLHADLQVGIKEIQNGDTVDAASAFAQFREQHR